MDPDHNLICELFPWLTEVMEDRVKENYFKILCDSTGSREIFDDFLKCVPKYTWSNESEVRYMWGDFNLMRDEPWIDPLSG